LDLKISAYDLQVYLAFVIENTVNDTAKIMVCIYMNFYPNPDWASNINTF